MTTVFLIPSLLSPDGLPAIHPYTLQELNQCQVIFAEQLRTTRRFLKSMDAAINIDAFEWHEMQPGDADMMVNFKKAVESQKNIAIISEAGCPGVADPGQSLVLVAHQLGCQVKPLVGPSSILLALMASGMNGQHFEFVGYLPIEQSQRHIKIKELEMQSVKRNSTAIFIETPYRNDTLWNAMLQHLHPETLLCVAKDLTGTDEFIKTATVAQWRKESITLGKVPVVFLLYAGKPI
jgi:16S rRNA (cytidine1402-2'-O)-methyltransferase